MNKEVEGIRRTGEKRSSEISMKLTDRVIELLQENFSKGFIKLSPTKKKQLKSRLEEKYYSGIYQYLSNKKNVNNSMAKVTIEIISSYFSDKEVKNFSPYLYERIESYLEEIYNS